MEEKTPSVVLVVDDDPLILFMAVYSLQADDFVVLGASATDEALSLLDTHDIGVLVTDLNLAGSMDGIDLARCVQQRVPQAHIIVSSGDDPSASLARRGSIAFLQKPYRSHQLTSAVRGRK
ncbi:DNA-binding NtrC family response regulator [Sphingomonas trueperi]|uniref:response regulator n=1 Tax=Sphingomonas trueperi TaxID=53317 RepID=UPI003391C840